MSSEETVDVQVVEEAPAKPEKPKVLALEDRLRVENLRLKLENIQLQLQIMQSDLNKAIGTRNVEVGNLNKLRDELFEKYGFDLGQMKLNEDGTFVPLQAVPQAR